jgi:protoporphyrinogen oxidase
MSADWAGQRIKASLTTMVFRSIIRDKDFIVKTFEFPTGGSRSVYEAQLSQLNNSPHHESYFNETPSLIQRTDNGYNVEFQHRPAMNFSHIIWTGYLDDLLDVLADDTIADIHSLRATAQDLRYRNLVLLNFVFDNEDLRSFQEHWIDVHDPDILALRVTNFANYKTSRVQGVSGVGIEYNCWPEDDIWQLSDDKLQELGMRELQSMSLIGKSVRPQAFCAIRVERAYPVYFTGYRDKVTRILEHLNYLPNLITTGRNGLYKWNNMHHSVKTGILAARNVIGEQNDLTTVKGLVSIGKDND